MTVLLANNAATTLSGAIDNVQTTIPLAAGTGIKFPSPTGGNWFPVTVIKSTGVLEIMKCTSRSVDVLTVVRAQEGTTATSFTAGDRVELRLTAAALDDIALTGAEILAKLITVDGSGSDLDADRVDGLEATQLLRADVDDYFDGRLIGTSQNGGIKFTYGANGSTPGFDTSGASITGGADYGGLGKRNNVDIQSWFGVSFSPTYGTGAVPRGEPAFAVDVRTGIAYAYTDFYVGTDRVFHQGFMGAGTGLDADKVDGLQASQFLRADTADETTGTLTIKGNALYVWATAGSNGHLYYKNDVGTNRGLMFWDRNADVIRLRRYAVDGSTVEGQISITSTEILATNDIRTTGDIYADGSYYWGDNKRIVRFSDSWLRLNDGGDFTTGIYCGASVFRTDGSIQVGNAGGDFLVSSSSFKYSGNDVIHNGNKNSYVGDFTASISTSSYIESGRGGGGVALTVNDGYGNANVAFNHRAGVPEQAGNSARIDVNTDTVGSVAMTFSVKSSVSAGVATSLTTGLTIYDTKVATPLYFEEGGTALSAKYLGIGAKAADSNKLDGYDSAQSNIASTVVVRDSAGDIKGRLFRSEYASNNGTIGAIMTQVDLGGTNNNYIRPTAPATFRSVVTDAYYLGISAKAADSNLLDGLDSTQFLRSDATDIKTAGDTVYNDNRYLKFGTGSDFEMFCNGSNMYMDMNSTGVSALYLRDGTTERFRFTRSNGEFRATSILENGTSLASKYLGISAKAADANLLDGNDSSYFQRNLNDYGGIEINGGGTGNRVTYLDLHSDDINTDYSSRIYRTAGVDGDLRFMNAGAGDVTLEPSTGGGIMFNPGGSNKARFNSAGNFLIGVGGTSQVHTSSGGTYVGHEMWLGGLAMHGRNADLAMYLNRQSTTGGIVSIRYDGSQVGLISVTGSSTSYGTSSDYRLKENVVPLIGAMDRVNQIPVHRFNFTSEPGVVVDGFLAHELQEVVPEAATGTKDGVDAEGNPEYQTVDQSKIVPLLTAALQEVNAKLEQALATIAQLENRVTALENP